MTSKEFETYLRGIQNSPYDRLNDYFAWEKLDKTLFMIGIKSHFINDILKYAYDSLFQTHSVHFYNIAPDAPHLRPNGPHFDPVKELVKEVSGYRFLGAWHAPELLMEDPSGTGKVLACGRWELVRDKILQPEIKASLDLRISEAQKAAAAALGSPSISPQSE